MIGTVNVILASIVRKEEGDPFDSNLGLLIESIFQKVSFHERNISVSELFTDGMTNWVVGNQITSKIHFSALSVEV